MGLESAPQNPLGRIDPGSLIGLPEPVVTPSAVAALSTAFRQGVVTSDDIISRYGELAQKKKKSELMSLDEMASPEAVASRAQATATQTAQGALGQAQAEAGLPMVGPNQALQKQELELKAAELRHGPAIKYFQAYSAEAGITAQPMLENGNPDYSEMARIGAQLYAWKTEKELAKERLEPAQLKDALVNGQKVLMKINKRGELITPEFEKVLTERILRPFTNIAPGGVQTSAVPAPAVAAPAGQPAAQAAPAAAPSVIPAGQPVPGIGMSLGATTEGIKAPTEAQQRAQLALARFGQSNDMLQSLREAGYDPATTMSWINGLLPEIFKSGDRKAYEAATGAWSQGLLRLESGAAIAPREKTWYERSFFAQVNDPPELVAQKEMMRSNIEKMVAEMAQAGGILSPESAAQTKRIYEHADRLAGAPARPTTVAGQYGPDVTLSTGAVVRKNLATGQYEKVSDAPVTTAPVVQPNDWARPQGSK